MIIIKLRGAGLMIYCDTPLAIWIIFARYLQFWRLPAAKRECTPRTFGSAFYSTAAASVNHVHEDGGYCLEEPVLPKCLQSAARRKINMEPVPWTRCLVTFTYIFIQPAAFFSSRPVAKSTRIIIIIRERGLARLLARQRSTCAKWIHLYRRRRCCWESGADRL